MKIVSSDFAAAGEGIALTNAYLSYIVTSAFCLVFTATIFFRLQSEIGNQRELVSLKKMIAAYIVVLTFDIAWAGMEGGLIRPGRTWNAFFNAVSIAAVVPGCYYWFQFVETRICPEKILSKKIWRLLAAPAVAVCAADMVSMFTGWVFYIDSGGHYQLGKYFWIQEVVTIAYLLFSTIHSLYIVFWSSCREKRRECLSYVVYMCACFAILTVEEYVPTIPLLELGIFGVILRLFLNLYLEQTYTLAKEEKELAESRMTIMLSQIQPHFLYNALAVIQDLCHGKAPEAEAATVEFTEFLRGNMDSLQIDGLISFQKELYHTKNYLALEERRFLGRLSIVYDIRTDDFQIPPLTLQPIVENAVRHGVMQRTEGGTVTISTEKTPDFYFVTVRDNGVGFDPTAPMDGQRSHIGIANVRERLRTMCGGTVTIDSAAGEGTVTTIAIPVKASGKESNQ